MTPTTILIVEDEKNIVTLVRYALEEQGFRVLAASRGDEGLSLIRQNTGIDLVLLDLMLPGLNGIEICKAVRANEKTKSVPIMMLTAKNSEIDKVVGLEMGADDYLTKPFSTRELVARVKALLRRTQNPSGQAELIQVGTIRLNAKTHEVSVQNRKVELTSKEFRLLRLLMESGGRVLSREELLTKVWGYDRSLNIETRTIDIHIANLRKKIRTESQRILTITNEGYRFDVE